MSAIRVVVILAVVFAAAPLVGSAAPGGEAPAVDPARVEQARAIANDLTSALSLRLVEEIKRGGPGAAVKVCSEVAPALAASHSTGGVTVRRVSLKTRNPANTPDAYETAQLERLAQLHAEKQAPVEVVEVVADSGRQTLRYMRPITVVERCLACHGPVEKISPEVRRLLAETYPQDRATGYAAGDFRGAVSVPMPLS